MRLIFDRCVNSDLFRFFSVTEGKRKTSWHRRLGLDVSLTGRLYDLWADWFILLVFFSLRGRCELICLWGGKGMRRYSGKREAVWRKWIRRIGWKQSYHWQDVFCFGIGVFDKTVMVIVCVDYELMCEQGISSVVSYRSESVTWRVGCRSLTRGLYLFWHFFISWYGYRGDK